MHAAACDYEISDVRFDFFHYLDIFLRERKIQLKSKVKTKAKKYIVEATISYIFQTHSSETKLTVLYIYLIYEYSPIFSLRLHHKQSKKAVPLVNI